MDPKIVATINAMVNLLKEHKAFIVQLQNRVAALEQAVAAGDSQPQFASVDEYKEAVLNSADEEAI